MFDLEKAIRERHSTRMFLPHRQVPRNLVDEALRLAQCAPSNSDIQPWHMVFVSGARRDRLVAALLDETRRRPPNIPPLPETFQHYRRELGTQVYGAMGIAIEDRASHDAAVLRNWEFFRAPLAGIVCMHRDLGPPNALSVGMFLQTLLLALTQRGLGSCVEVSIAGYPEIVREQLEISAELSILCGLAIGYPAPDFPRQQAARQPRPHREERGVPRHLMLAAPYVQDGAPAGERFIEWNFVSSSKERIAQAKTDWFLHQRLFATTRQSPTISANEYKPRGSRASTASSVRNPSQRYWVQEND
jgi:nitroreductase